MAEEESPRSLHLEIAEDAVNFERRNLSEEGNSRNQYFRSHCEAYKVATLPIQKTNFWSFQDLYFHLLSSIIVLTFGNRRTGGIITERLEEKLESLESSLSLETFQENNVLHVLASASQSLLLSKIFTRNHPLVTTQIQQPNKDGDLPLHVAASTGDLETVKCIIDMLISSAAGNSSDPGRINTINERGNTVLHVALENNHQKVAEYLVDRISNGSIYYSANNHKRTPLGMAAEAGNVTLVAKMASHIQRQIDVGHTAAELFSESEVGRSILRGAIVGRNTVVLRIILELCDIDGGKDSEWMTPLTLAVYINNVDAVRCLLDKSTKSVYDIDGNGFRPIHVASRKGYVKIVEEILNRCPDSRELLDRKGRNILHVAAGQGRAEMVKYITKKHGLEILFNERDIIGETPLHVATRNRHPRIVKILTECQRVNLHLLNNAGMTALDIAEDSKATSEMLFRKKLTIMALKSAYAPRSGETLAARAQPVIGAFNNTKNNYDDLLLTSGNLNTLLLVSTLVATITFAAGFTMPGGYESSGDDKGMAIFSKRFLFYIFVLCNTIAMYISIVVAIFLIWAQTGDRIVIYAAMTFVLRMLGFALIMMSTSFLAAVTLVTARSNLLSETLTFIGSLFTIIITLLFAPLTVRYSSKKSITHYTLQASFSLLLLVTRYNSEVDIEADIDVNASGDVCDSNADARVDC